MSSIRRYASKERSRGVFIFAMGLVWVLLQGGLALGQRVDLSLSGVSLGYGMAAGLMLTIEQGLSSSESSRPGMLWNTGVT